MQSFIVFDKHIKLKKRNRKFWTKLR